MPDPVPLSAASPPPIGKPAAEVVVEATLLRALLEEQHADLAGLPITPLAEGWDNVLFRLGDDLIARLPRRQAAANLVEHELTWLPRLPADLPLPIPRPVRSGQPGAGFPWRWSVVPWLPGADAEATPPDDLDATAEVLGAFLAALHQPAPPDAPANPYRGVPLAERAEVFERGLERAAGWLDVASVRSAWEELLPTPPWRGPARWLHGDTHPRNLLVHHGRLSGVVDFGDLTGGDPASDLAVAWMLFPPGPRHRFRAALGPTVDDHTWARARGWALALGVALGNGDDRVRAIGLRTIVAALAD